MGASVSVLEATQIPAVLDRDQFEILTTGTFRTGAYDQIADSNGKVSRERLVEVVSMTDCYVSHEWGIDHSGRDTSSRVRKLCQFLQSKGLFTTFDEGRFTGVPSANTIKQQIQSSQCVILCMTERYFYQLTLPTESPSKTEFYEAMNNKELRCIIPLVMESVAFHIPEHITRAYPLFMNKTHLDFTTYANIGNDDAGVLSDLYLYVTRCIRPLRDGGSFKQQRNQFLSTIAGRHYKWMLQHVPKFGHTESMKHAETLASANIGSATRLWQLTQHDSQYLQNLGIPENDAVAIRTALKTDLMSNFDTVNAKRVDAAIDAQNRALEAEMRDILQRTADAIDMKVKFTELQRMGVEDGYSRELREQSRIDSAEWAYRQGRDALLRVSEQQQRHYENTLQAMRDAQRRRNIDNDGMWRHEGFLHIGRVTEPIVVSGLLYKLFIKIDRATAHLRSEDVCLGDAQQLVDFPEEYLHDFHFKRHRVQTFVDRASVISNASLMLSAGSVEEDSTSRWTAAETWEGKQDMTYEERNSRLVYLLQEAAYLCRAVVNVARGNTHHVAEFAESGVVKLLMALLAQAYLFNCPFESLFMPMSFHHLLMPSEVLWAMRYLIKCDPGRRNVNAKVAFLFGEAGAVELCVEVARFHLNDMNIASVAIETLYVLVDIYEKKDNANLQRLLCGPSNLILLTVVLEKYQEYFSPVALVLHAGIIGIVAQAAVTAQYEGLLRAYRANLVAPLLNTILPLVEERSDPELCCRFCAILSNLFFSLEYHNSLYFTSDFVPKSDSVARELSKVVNYRVALRFVKKVLTSFADNEVVTLAAVVALGDMAFINEKIKTELFRMKLHEVLVKVLKLRMKRLDNAHPKWDSFTESIELGVDTFGVREVLYEGLITAANVIMVPPFLTHDTRTAEAGLSLPAEIEKARLKNPAEPVTSAAVGGAKLPAAATSEPPSTLLYFVQHGMAELVMKILTRYQEDRTLTRSMLVFVNKFVYRGRHLSALRLVTLGFCEQVRFANIVLRSADPAHHLILLTFSRSYHL
jgi:hypothetical protein